MRELSPAGWRRLVFGYELGVFLVLVVLALLYYKLDGVRAMVPDRFQGLPVQTAWFGALGGIAIALKGVYDHPADPEPGKEGWNNRWVLWHLGRPFSGMIVGIATLALLKAIYPNGTPATAVVLSAAFVLGTQERRFFEFVNQVGGVILAVPQQNPTPPQTAPPPPSEGGGSGGTGGNAGGQGAEAAPPEDADAAQAEGAEGAGTSQARAAEILQRQARA